MGIAGRNEPGSVDEEVRIAVQENWIVRGVRMEGRDGGVEGDVEMGRQGSKSTSSRTIECSFRCKLE